MYDYLIVGAGLYGATVARELTDVVAKYLDKIRKKDRTLLVIDHTDGIEDYFSRWIRIDNKDDVLYGIILK